MSVERLRRAIRVTRGYGEIHAWLVDALVALEDGRNIGEALELTGARALRRRNRLIVEAAEAIAPHQPPWRQARALRRALPVATTTRDNRLAYRLLRDAAAYKRLPATQRGLYNILMTEKIDR